MYTDRNGKEKKFIAKHDITSFLIKDLQSWRKEFLPNLLVKTAIKGGYNTKYREDYRELSFNPETKESCWWWNYSSKCIVYIDQKTTVSLSEVGNFLIGYNFYHAGFSRNDIYLSWLMTEDLLKRWNILQDPSVLQSSFDNEVEDIHFYDAGYYFAESQESWHYKNLSFYFK